MDEACQQDNDDGAFNDDGDKAPSHVFFCLRVAGPVCDDSEYYSWVQEIFAHSQFSHPEAFSFSAQMSDCNTSLTLKLDRW